MSVFRILGLAVLLGVSVAGAKPPEGRIDIDASMAFSPGLQKILLPEIREFYKQALAMGLYLASEVPAPSTPRFPWSNLPCRTQFYITTADDPEIAAKKLPGNQLSGSIVQVQDEVWAVKIYLLFDRIYFHDRQPKQGAFIELVTTLAFQLDLVRSLLAMGQAKMSQALRPEEYKAVKVHAYQASLKFMLDIQASPDIAALDAPSVARLPELIQHSSTELLRLQCGDN